MKALIILILWTFWNSAFSQTEPLESARDEPLQVDAKQIDIHDIAFGFSNEAGNQTLILNDENSDSIVPSKFSLAFSYGGRPFDIHFIQEKKAGIKDNNRATYHNFENSGGYLYKTRYGTVNKDHAVVLTSRDFFRNRMFLKLKTVDKGLSNTNKLKVESDKGRKIKRYKGLVQLDENRSIYLFEFERKKNSVLAALVLITPDKIVYEDFPAEYNSISTWSVDDGGEFGMEYIHVLAAFEKQGVLEIVTEWGGAEGYSIEYMKEEGTSFKTLKTGYRYAAPL